MDLLKIENINHDNVSPCGMMFQLPQKISMDIQVEINFLAVWYIVLGYAYICLKWLIQSLKIYFCGTHQKCYLVNIDIIKAGSDPL